MTCKAEGCRKKAHAKGFCHTHYSRIWRTGSLEIRNPEDHVCLECGEKAVALSLCRRHYMAYWRGMTDERHTIPTRPWLVAHQSRTGTLHMQSWVLVRGKRTLVAGCNMRLTLNPNSKRRGSKPCLKCRQVLKEHGLLD